VPQSRAQEENLGIDVRLTSQDDDLVNVIYPGGCNSPIANKIDAFFEERGAPLAGEGCNFVYHANENEVEPFLVPAIAWCESNGGIVTPQFGNQESFNAWGWAVYDSNDTTREVDGYCQVPPN